jgi:hypothetical protein
MTKDNEQYAYLTVVGEFSPERITSQLGLTPSDSWMKGDLNEKTHFERKFSRCSLHSRLERSASLENYVRDVLEQVLPKGEQIRRIGIECQVSVQLVGYFDRDFPGFCMDRDLISSLAHLDVGIDCDFYYLYSESREDS